MEKSKALQVEVNDGAVVQSGATIWNSPVLMSQAMQSAQMLAKSAIVPQAYRGKEGDCLIAIDMANRMGLSPLMVMQSSQVVQGNFTWKGTACKAMIDSCGRYVKTRYVEVGKPNEDSHGYYLEATTKDGEVINGVAVTIAMAKKEGWYGRNGSKWATMPELMLRYRAAAFFIRTECASLAMGFLTSEEQYDITAEETISPKLPENRPLDGKAEVDEETGETSEKAEHTPENEPVKSDLGEALHDEPVLTVEEIRDKYGLNDAERWLNWLVKKQKVATADEMTDEQRRAARDYLYAKAKRQAESAEE